jgi:hypothetical protein
VYVQSEFLLKIARAYAFLLSSWFALVLPVQEHSGWLLLLKFEPVRLGAIEPGLCHCRRLLGLFLQASPKENVCASLFSFGCWWVPFVSAS